METEQEMKEFKERTDQMEVKELSLGWKIIFLILLIAVIIGGALIEWYL